MQQGVKMNESCPTCKGRLFFDPRINLPRCPQHGTFSWTCYQCGSQLSLVNLDLRPMNIPGVGLYMRQALECPNKGHGSFIWMDNWEIRQYYSDYFYAICTSMGASDTRESLMPFAKGVNLDGDRPYYVSGGRAAVNYIISEMKALGFEEAWHPKGEPWYACYFGCRYPRVPKPLDWGQRMERVNAV